MIYIPNFLFKICSKRLLLLVPNGIEEAVSILINHSKNLRRHTKQRRKRRKTIETVSTARNDVDARNEARRNGKIAVGRKRVVSIDLRPPRGRQPPHLPAPGLLAATAAAVAAPLAPRRRACSCSPAARVALGGSRELGPRPPPTRPQTPKSMVPRACSCSPASPAPAPLAAAGCTRAASTHAVRAAAAGCQRAAPRH